MASNRKNRREELLAAARDRLTQEHEAGTNDNQTGTTGPEIRYRGQVVRQRTGSTPGSPSAAIDHGDARAALEKIKGLYRDGLISRAEAERKRSAILGRI